MLPLLADMAAVAHASVESIAESAMLTSSRKTTVQLVYATVSPAPAEQLSTGQPKNYELRFWRLMQLELSVSHSARYCDKQAT